MLGNLVSVHITHPIGSVDKVSGMRYMMNFGDGLVSIEHSLVPVKCYVIGMMHPVKKFEGKIIATLKRDDNSRVYIAATKKAKFINCDIIPLLEPMENIEEGRLTCLYERSCGAAVYRFVNGEPRFLLIKNKRSENWGFPKGHMEMGETPEETARREVLEETGIHICLIEGFCSESGYKIGNKIQKNVSIFLAVTKDTQTKIQHDEVEDYAWLTYSKAYERFNFENDRLVLSEVYDYLKYTIGVKFND